MSPKPGQGQHIALKQSQTLNVTPQMAQRLHILQCNEQQLALEIQQMLDKNIMLAQKSEVDFEAQSEHTNDTGDSESLPDDMSTEVDADIAWDDIYDNDYLETFDERPKKLNDEVQGFQDDWVPDELSFDAQIEEAIFLSELDDDEKQIAYSVLTYLDEHYFLTEPLDKLAKRLNCPISELNYIVDIIKHLEPAGVASANVKECLLAQLQHVDALQKDIAIDAYEILRDYFDYIDKKPDFIQKRLGLSSEEYEAAMQLIRTLSPYPNPTESSHATAVKPEVFVRQRMGLFYASPNQDARFDLSINEEYASMANNFQGDEKRFMKAQLQEAKFFLDALDLRQQTVVRVANAIVMEQQEYFIEGEKAMRPLVMREIAEQLDLSESTISRAVNGKYLSFNQRLIELRFFFTQGLATTDDEAGESISEEGATSATATKAHIKEIIANEPPKKPLSDSKIETLLHERGINISRRTVTKYREALGIPKTSQRKRLK